MDSGSRCGVAASSETTLTDLRLGPTFRLDQINVTDTERLGELIQRDHGWVPPAAFEATEILLAESGTGRDFFLRQTLLMTYSGKVLTNQFAHIHAQEYRDLHTFSLSTIICI